MLPNSALHIRNGPYEAPGAVFGVKQSIIVGFDTADVTTATKYGVPEDSKVLKHDFVLVSNHETEKLRDENALQAMKALGRRVKLLNHCQFLMLIREEYIARIRMFCKLS